MKAPRVSRSGVGFLTFVAVDEPRWARHSAAVPLLRTGPLLASVVLSITVGAGAGCESEAPRGNVLARELDKICHAVELSGAPLDGTTNDLGATAVWLGENIKTEEGLAFLRAFAVLGNDKPARYKMLDDAARANGVRDCPLLAYWK
jgi:hypothetical protein